MSALPQTPPPFKAAGHYRVQHVNGKPLVISPDGFVVMDDITDSDRATHVAGHLNHERLRISRQNGAA